MGIGQVEALFLGDNIAVFAPGGKLAQYGAPEEILTNPANDFVESFVSQSNEYFKGQLYYIKNKDMLFYEYDSLPFGVPLLLYIAKIASKIGRASCRERV